MNDVTIARVVTKGLVPFLLLFALYTQFHGDLGAGGGFQAGVILAAALLLHALVFGMRASAEALSPRWLEIAAAAGVLVYAGTGLVALFGGRPYLDYGVFAPHHPEHGQHWGILLVELGVAITVSSVMVTIVSTFVRRGDDPEEEGDEA